MVRPFGQLVWPRRGTTRKKHAYCCPFRGCASTGPKVQDPHVTGTPSYRVIRVRVLGWLMFMLVSCQAVPWAEIPVIGVVGVMLYRRATNPFHLCPAERELKKFRQCCCACIVQSLISASKHFHKPGDGCCAQATCQAGIPQNRHKGSAFPTPPVRGWSSFPESQHCFAACILTSFVSCP